jgi:two-component system, OmpR family, response regulator
MTITKTKILLAEDDENLGLLLREYLKAKNFETNLFANGETAFRDFVKNDYDICILDVMMPIKDGYTLAREIRQVNEEIPIIFLTAKSMKEDVIEGFSIGADDYITKPFSMEELLFRIEAILKRTSSAFKTIRLNNLI